MPKPVATFAWATDANYAAGPAAGNPTKILIPNAGQALVPGDDLVPEYMNQAYSEISAWVTWVFDGSSAGAADAHIVETDANGDTAVQDLTCVELTLSGAGITLDDSTLSDFVIFRTILPGVGANNGGDISLVGMQGQAVAAGNNNDGGHLRLSPGREGAGGTFGTGGAGMVRTTAQHAGISDPNAGHYSGFYNFPTTGLATTRIRLPSIWGTSTVSFVTLTFSHKSSGVGTDSYAGEAHYLVTTNALGEPVAAATGLVNTGGTGFTGLANAPTTIVQQGAVLTFLELVVQEFDNVNIRSSVHVSIVVGPTFP